MIAAWARLTELLTRCTWARLREPTRMNGRCSGMPGLPAWAPCGISAGHGGAAAAAGAEGAVGLDEGGRTAMERSCRASRAAARKRRGAGACRFAVGHA